MVGRIIVAFTGIAFLLSGLFLVAAPRVAWRVAENMVAAPAQSHVYIAGAILLIWGLVLLYAGVMRLTYYSLFVSIVGVAFGLIGLVIVVAPGHCLAWARAFIMDRPERSLLTLSYISGAVRIILGYFLLAAALKPRRSP